MDDSETPKAGVFQRVLGIEVAVTKLVTETGEQEPFVRMKVDVSVVVDAPNADSAFIYGVLGDLTQGDSFAELEEDVRSAINRYWDPNSEGVPDGDGNVRVEVKGRNQVRKFTVN